MPEADEVLPAPLPPYRVLTGLVDRFGRTQTFHREAAGEFSGEITGVTDGAGRHFRLVLTTQAQRAEEARQQASSGGTEPSAFPDTLPGYTEYGRDNGIRLSAVWLTQRPGIPGEFTCRAAGALWAGRRAANWRWCMTVVANRCAALLTMINTGAGWWRTVTRAGRKSVTVTTATAGDRTA
ncbi:RhsB protein [Escherichia coli]|uniref:RhsB protein n=1 Tax=Escherichia coli TaxID=562 RepID=A0A377AKU4_ECOLX|nr:RhsB protein [Escherichia coli]